MPTATATAGNLQNFTYDQLLFWANAYSDNRFNEYASAAAQYGVGEEEALLNFLENSQSPVHVWKTADGGYNGWFYETVEQATQTNPLNSNVTTVSRGNFRQMVGQKFEDVGGVLTRNMTRFPTAGSLGDKAAYLLGSIGGAYMAASTGIWLGKTIDSALYNLNPDYWDSIGLGTLDPDTWAGLINDGDSPFGGMMNFILGLDPDTGSSQMYVDENALAYLSYVLAQGGFFSASDGYTYNGTSISRPYLGTYWNEPAYATPIQNVVATPTTGGQPFTFTVDGGIAELVQIYDTSRSRWTGGIISKDSGVTVHRFQGGSSAGDYPLNSRILYTVDGVLTTIGYSTTIPYNQDFYTTGAPINSITTLGTGNIPSSEIYATILLGSQAVAIEGIGNQDGATLPDVSTWDSPANTLTSLKSQYPDSWSNALVWDNYDDDGTARQTTWIPIPSAVATYANDNQPTSGGQTQTNTDVSTFPDTLIKVITELVQQTKTQTEPAPEIPPSDPVDTGTGDTTPPVVPTGTASALWSVYHPTQAQVNSFGAWLWSDNFLDNILKIMNDPMSGIITLHKVFATPVDSGSATIVVGKLDSGVSSATVNQQYVTVDCGSVDLYEQFGNVFDYNPFTDVSLYLPFIGIVPLDTADVMRSTISITYGVDVYTGACLAQVEVTRDGNTVNMYQYAGVCSVEYPLTGAQHNGLITGLLGIGTSVAGLVTGNAPMAIGGVASGVASAAKRSQSRANSFSGNAGAMGIKTPYLIISRPQTKVAATFPELQGYPTNTSVTLGECSGQVRVRAVHVEGINATEQELQEIESLLLSGVLV